MLDTAIYINGFSLVAPGLTDKKTIHSVLTGQQVWVAESLPKLSSNLLPANERRRTSIMTNLVLKAAESLLYPNQPTNEVSTVFASSDGDLQIDDAICKALADEPKMISPTQFGNSVHNAAAGYCAIASQLTGNSVSLSSANGSYVAGLLDSVSQLLTGQANVVFVAYDAVAPEPLHSRRKFDHSLALALRLSLEPDDNCLGQINVSLNNSSLEDSSCQNFSLEKLRLANPSGVGLPLIEAIARHQRTTLYLPYKFQQQLQVQLKPL